MASDFEARIRNVTAVLGPTNTGKTHLAIERMLGHESGMIGLPLRLLAREVYDKIKPRVGADKVALITGEEKIKPEQARYWVSTVEAMPRDIDVDFLAIDEIQLVRRSRARPCLHRPPAACARPLRNVAARRANDARSHQRSDPGRQLHLAARGFRS